LRGEKRLGETVEIETVSGIGRTGELGGVGGATVSRVTTMDLWSVPTSLVQLTVIELAPSPRFTRLALVLVVPDPPTLQVVPDGITALPLIVKATRVEDAVVVNPFSGLVIATDGPSPRVMMTDALPSPKALEHKTSIAFGPADSATELTVALAVPESFTLQVVPEGMLELPSTAKETLTDAVAVHDPDAGCTIATVGTTPRSIEKLALPEPKAFVQLTVIVLPPSVSEYGLTCVLAEDRTPTLHVVPPGIDVDPSTE
jgi:hypothetical protein